MLTLSDIDAQAIKLHTAANGTLWVAAGRSAPRPAGQLKLLPELLAAYTQPRVRMFGLARQARLICEVGDVLREHAPGVPLELASPQFCEAKAELLDGSIPLYRMRQCWWPAAVGGWHLATRADFAAYALIVNPTSPALFQNHPAYQALTFITGLDPLAAAQVLALIIDPRWRVEHAHPERSAALCTYLGVTPWTIARCRGTAFRRFELVCRAWRGTPGGPGETGPGAFLWRRFRAAGGGSHGLLRASQAFVSYLAKTWRQRLHELTSKQVLELFEPELLFQGEEVLAYRQHMQPVIRSEHA